jgi:hypothetical protein
MKFLNKLKSLFIKNTFIDDLALAESSRFKEIASLIEFNIRGAANISGSDWVNRESAIAAGYFQGFADVLAQACGRDRGSELGANIALQFARVILQDRGSEKINEFIEYSLFSASGDKFLHGVNLGGQDANTFLNKNSVFNALANHLRS